MRSLLALLLIASLGCVDTSKAGIKKPKTPISPSHVSSTIDAAAAAFFIDYATGAALAADETSAKCAANQFKDITEADDFFSEQTKAARLKANESFAAAMTAALADEKNKPASSVADVYRKTASGFRRIANRP